MLQLGLVDIRWIKKLYLVYSVPTIILRKLIYPFE